MSVLLQSLSEQWPLAINPVVTCDEETDRDHGRRQQQGLAKTKQVFAVFTS